MGLNFTKSTPEYSLRLSSINHFYRSPTIIEGELHLNIRRKLLIEKKLRIDLIGQLIEKSKSSTRTFFTYSFPLVTSHENGMARIIKQKQIAFPFRIPLGKNLPPSCQFKEFSVIYYLNVYHDGRLLPNLRRNILVAPPTPHITVPLPCKLIGNIFVYHIRNSIISNLGSNDVTMICSLQKSFYSTRNDSIVPLSLSISNPKQKFIHSITIQLIAIVSLNGIKHENDIFQTVLNEIKKNEINTICELNLPSNLSSTYIPNKNGQPDNVPLIDINYEFRLTAQIEGTITPNLRLVVPIGIE